MYIEKITYACWSCDQTTSLQ